MQQTTPGALDAAALDARPLTQGGDMFMPAPLPKLFVLDTNVVLHDSGSILNFEEHDISIPITVLKDHNRFKQGSEDIHFHARQFLRQMDRLTGDILSPQGPPLGEG